VTRPLWQIAAIRIVFFGLIAALAQMALVVADYYFNDEELGRLLIEQQVDQLGEGQVTNGSATRYALPDEMADLFAPGRGYFARVRTVDGTILFSACDAACEDHFLSRTVRPPDFWVRFIQPGKPLHVAGGGTVERDGQVLMVEFATVGDSEGLIWGVFWHEVLDHLVVPMSLLLLFAVGGAIVSIIAALRPVEAAAQAADNLDPLEVGEGLPTGTMPREISRLTGAVNRAFKRSGDLIRGQRMLTSAIAHEVRTPLAIIKLELSGIDSPKARKAEADVDELSDFVAQLTALARLEAINERQFQDTNLAQLCEDVVSAVAPWVLARGDTIAFEKDVEAMVLIIPSLIRDACRNLIENAVRHSPPGTEITVRVTGGPIISIIDRKRQADASMRPSDSLGIGLAIVERVLTLHGARLVQHRNATGMVVSIHFNSEIPT
jgi:two-component system sensor histidine kinase QseC